MKLEKVHTRIFRIFFAFIGILSLIKIVKYYGVQNIFDEINRTGYWLVLLALTFIPTLICYSVSWLLATDHRRMSGNMTISKKVFIFTRFTIASIAWNNLTPFLKVGGEPLKFLMLSKYLSKSESFASTINYNIIHLLATGISFIISALLLLLFYYTTSEISVYLIGFALIFSAAIYSGFSIMGSNSKYASKAYRFQFLRHSIINIKLSFRMLKKFYKNNPEIFFMSLVFDIIARFIEGITFYFAFNLIKHPITLLSSSLLDVGRTFVDTIFFFIPYQIGSREEGVRFFMEKILNIQTSGFLTAVILYRFVEIFWIIIGYIIWVSTKSSSKEVKV